MPRRSSSPSAASPRQQAEQISVIIKGMPVAEGSENHRLQCSTIVMWEVLRYALLCRIIKPEWVKAVRAIKKIQPHLDEQVFSILRNSDFPRPWGSLSKEAQAAFVQSIGHLGRAAKLLSSREARSIYRKFSRCTDGHPATVEHQGSKFTILEIRPEASINMVLKNLADDLEALGVKRKVLKNGNDLKQMLSTLSGLCSLWLWKGGVKRSDRNKFCFHERWEKSDTADLSHAEENAQWLVANIAWEAWRLVKDQGFAPPPEKSF